LSSITEENEPKRVVQGDRGVWKLCPSWIQLLVGVREAKTTEAGATLLQKWANIVTMLHILVFFSNWQK